MFYKICDDLTPSYLSSLVPQSVISLFQYGLRNADTLNLFTLELIYFTGSFYLLL